MLKYGIVLCIMFILLIELKLLIVSWYFILVVKFEKIVCEESVWNINFIGKKLLFLNM